MAAVVAVVEVTLKVPGWMMFDKDLDAFIMVYNVWLKLSTAAPLRAVSVSELETKPESSAAVGSADDEDGAGLGASQHDGS